MPSGLITWKDGDFVLANDRVAIVIEDVGNSDLYDPWGGRPVGLARVAGGHLIEPDDFGELFFLTGRSTIVTDSVTVINDGSDGNPAIIRATGKLHPLPFFESVIAAVYHDELTDVDAAIDYELAPGSNKVDVRMRYASPREADTEIPSTLHAFMYTERMPAFQPVLGFDESLSQVPYIAFVDDDATSWAYMPGDGKLSMSLSVSGFLGAFSGGYTIPACGTTDRIHASIVIGGPGLDGIQTAVAGVRGEAQRTITGTVTRGGTAAAGVHVHATDNGAYLTRVTTDADGHFSLNVPAGANIHLDAYKRGDAVGTAEVGAGTSATIELPANGSIHVTASPAEPVRVQVLPAEGQAIPSVADSFGEPEITGGRLHVAYAVTGDVTLTAPPGTWRSSCRAATSTSSCARP